jgi:hypothetical protein
MTFDQVSVLLAEDEEFWSLDSRTIIVLQLRMSITRKLSALSKINQLIDLDFRSSF